jgi:hypothetical protein
MDDEWRRRPFVAYWYARLSILHSYSQVQACRRRLGGAETTEPDTRVFEFKNELETTQTDAET